MHTFALTSSNLWFTDLLICILPEELRLYPRRGLSFGIHSILDSIVFCFFKKIPLLLLTAVPGKYVVIFLNKQ